MSVENEMAINKLKRTKEGEMVKLVLLGGSEVVGCLIQTTSKSTQIKLPLLRKRGRMISGGYPITIFLSQISRVLPG